jgi:hypothetical protein
MPSQLSGNSYIEDQKLAWLKEPVLAELIGQRTMCLAIGGFVATHFVFLAIGVPVWTCPLRAGVGIPCPGCGMTRAVAALVRGDWVHSLHLHAFVPLFLPAILLVGVAGFLPEKPRLRLARLVAALERNTGITALVLMAMLTYWLVRLLLFRETFFALVR